MLRTCCDVCAMWETLGKPNRSRIAHVSLTYRSRVKDTFAAYHENLHTFLLPLWPCAPPPSKRETFFDVRSLAPPKTSWQITKRVSMVIKTRDKFRWTVSQTNENSPHFQSWWWELIGMSWRHVFLCFRSMFPTVDGRNLAPPYTACRIMKCFAMVLKTSCEFRWI